MLTQDPANIVTGRIIGSAIEVHRHLGPGLLESVYEQCLVHELRSAGMRLDTHVPLPIRYKGIVLEGSYKLDLIVEGQVVVELKAVEQLAWIHEAQLLTYLRLTGHKLGLVINFNVAVLKQGIRRVINSKGPGLPSRA